MTKLAHDCVLLGIPVDTWRLFYCDDPFYELWLTGLADRVHDTKRTQQKKAEAKGKRSRG